MKKNFYAIVLVIAMVVSLSSCNNGGYKYADRWDVDKDFNIHFINVDEDISNKYGVLTEQYDPLISEIKESVATNMKEYEFLKWDEFSNVKTAKIINLSDDEIEALPEDEKTVFNTTTCFYKNGVINILPNFYLFDEDYQRGTLTHEILHSLIPFDSDAIDRYNEGIVDYFMCKITNNPSNISYANEYETIVWLINTYDEKTVLKAICQGKLEELIDSSTKPRMGEKLNYALAITGTMADGIDYRKLFNVQLDILCHLTANEGKKEPDHGVELIDAMCVYLTGSHADTDYFEKLLE